MAKIKTYIESSTVDKTEVFPTLKGDFTFKKPSGKIYFKQELKDKVKFTQKADYDLVKGFYENECEEITFIVERLCGGSYETYWKGYFKMLPSIDNQELCNLTVEVKAIDPYKCFEEAVKEKKSFWIGTTRVEATPIGGSLETETCYSLSLTSGCTEYDNAIANPLADCLDDETEWCLRENIVTANGLQEQPDCDPGVNNTTEQTTVWHREVYTLDCSSGEPPFGDPSDWTILEEDCAGSGDQTWWRCPGSAGLLGPYSNGQYLNDTIETVVAALGCGLTVKSDFLGINPAGDAPVNDAYSFAEAYCRHITIHHKADVLDPAASDPSSALAWELKPIEFLSDLEKMFKLKYDIVGDVFILEHVSFFNSEAGLDESLTAMDLILDIGLDENVKYHEYYWPEDPSYAFRADPIVYDCGEITKEERCKHISTDLVYIENQGPDGDLSDNGFVLVSNLIVDGNNVIIDGNSPFTWSNLLNNLGKHDRLFKSGTLNGVSMDFLSWKPYRKQKSFTTTLCCSETFNPRDLVKTKIDDGKVAQAEFNLFTNKLKLEIEY